MLAVGLALFCLTGDDSCRTLVGSSGENQLLVAQPWVGLDGVRYVVSVGTPGIGRIGEPRLFLRRAVWPTCRVQPDALLEWLRLPGDAVLILGGVLPLIYLCWLEFASHGAR